jgi:hypothetical protein
MDERIFSKDYGKAIKRYLDMVAGTEGTDVSASAKPVTKPAEKMAAAPKPAAAKKAAPKKMVKKKANDAQLPLL